jgi:hypothetical protein
MIYGTRKVKKEHTFYWLLFPSIPPTANTARMAAIFHLFFQAIHLSMCQIEAMTFLAGWGLGLYHHKKNNSMDELDQSSLHTLVQHHENMLFPTWIKLGPPNKTGYSTKELARQILVQLFRNLNMVAPVYVFIIASNIQ